MYGKNEKEKKLNILINEKNREKIEKVLADFQRGYKTRTIDAQDVLAEAKSLTGKFNNVVSKKALNGCIVDWMPDAEKRLPGSYKYNYSALATAITIKFTGKEWKLISIAREQLERKVLYMHFSESFTKSTDFASIFEKLIGLSDFPDLETDEEKKARMEREKLRDNNSHINFTTVKDCHDITLRVGPAKNGFLTVAGVMYWFNEIKDLTSFQIGGTERTCKAHIVPHNIEIPGYYRLIFSTSAEKLKIYGSDGEAFTLENKTGFEIYRAGYTGMIIRFI